jgi:hypothetical protein
MLILGRHEVRATIAQDIDLIVLCQLDLEDQIPDHSTFSVNRYGRFGRSDLFRRVFEAVVWSLLGRDVAKDAGFAINAKEHGS